MSLPLSKKQTFLPLSRKNITIQLRILSYVISFLIPLIIISELLVTTISYNSQFQLTLHIIYLSITIFIGHTTIIKTPHKYFIFNLYNYLSYLNKGTVLI